MKPVDFIQVFMALFMTFFGSTTFATELEVEIAHKLAPIVDHAILGTGLSLESLAELADPGYTEISLQVDRKSEAFKLVATKESGFHVTAFKNHFGSVHKSDPVVVCARSEFQRKYIYKNYLNWDVVYVLTFSSEAIKRLCEVPDQVIPVESSVNEDVDGGSNFDNFDTSSPAFAKKLNDIGSRLLNDRGVFTEVNKVRFLETLDFKNPRSNRRALILYQEPKSDHNQAFVWPNREVLGAISLDHSIIFRRATSMNEVAEIIRENAPLDFLEIGGHGEKGYIELSQDKDGKYLIFNPSDNDRNLFPQEAMAEGSVILLEGCSNGSKEGRTKNIVDTMSSFFPSSTVIGGAQISRDSDLKVKSLRPLDVAFINSGGDFTYKASREMGKVENLASNDFRDKKTGNIIPHFVYDGQKWRAAASVDEALSFIRTHAQLYDGDVSNLAKSLAKIENGYRLINPTVLSHDTIKKIAGLNGQIRELVYVSTPNFENTYHEVYTDSETDYLERIEKIGQIEHIYFDIELHKGLMSSLLNEFQKRFRGHGGGLNVRSLVFFSSRGEFLEEDLKIMVEIKNLVKSSKIKVEKSQKQFPW